MAKQIEDIIPGEKRSIRDIPIPESRRKTINLIDEVEKVSPKPLTTSDENPPFPRSTEPTISTNQVYKQVLNNPSVSPMGPTTPRDFSPAKKKRKLPGNKFLYGGLALVLILILGVFSLMNSAVITYTPKSAPLSFAGEEFIAKKEGLPGDLLFSVIKISTEESVEAPATGESEVSERASGIIVVYNNSSTGSQRLIKNTRFETPDGKVYRVQNDIDVPGPNASEPGSLEVTVYADEPGESHNIGLTDFTIPGLKGDPRFETIYARSKTPMSGGIVGLVKNVSAEDRLSAEESLESTLTDSLLLEAEAQVPPDFVLLPNLTDISFESLPPATSASNMAVVKLRGNLSGIIFKKSDLVHYLASNKTTLASGEGVDADLSSLEIAFATPPSGDLSSQDEISINVSGETLLEWVSDEDALSNEIAGKSKDSLEGVLANYPSIVEAEGIVRPFWKRSFPDNPQKIKWVNSLK